MVLKILTLFAVSLSLFIPVSSYTGPLYKANTTGIDVSWPNCGKKLPANQKFSIIGVTGGLDFKPNKCMGEEASQLRNDPSLYVNTGYPGHEYAKKYQSKPKNCSTSDYECLAYNYGFNAGRYAVNYSLENGVVSSKWWLDVEIINSWTNNTNINKAELVGEEQAIRQGVNPTMIGYYTYPPEWQLLTNNWQNYLPTWIASNSNYRNDAINLCKTKGFTGGPIYLTQYTTTLDYDYACQ